MFQELKGKIRLKKGDLVQVIAGKDKGKQGKILSILPKKNAVIVEGVNMVTKHLKPTQKNPQGGKSVKEAPIHYSNVNIVDPKTSKPSRLGIKLEGNKKVRVAIKSGSVLNA
jgi:large subunit ribosomal protein L24